jgi:RNA polymerase sigma-70 factor, ECF subfamily
MESVKDISEHLRGAALGDTKAFEALYTALVDRVFAYVATRTNSREDAYEVTQDSFVELYRALPKFTYSTDAGFYTYLFTIVKRQLARYYDAKQKEPRSTIDPDTIAVHREHERDEAVAQALKTLDERTREIIELHHWSRFTFGEIASMLGMTESAVRVRHHRALGSLAHLLIT